jgi:hypothetical protein
MLHYWKRTKILPGIGYRIDPKKLVLIKVSKITFFSLNFNVGYRILVNSLIRKTLRYNIGLRPLLTNMGGSDINLVHHGYRTECKPTVYP